MRPGVVVGAPHHSCSLILPCVLLSCISRVTADPAGHTRAPPPGEGSWPLPAGRRLRIESHCWSLEEKHNAERVEYIQKNKNYNILFKQLFLICYGVYNKKENEKKKKPKPHTTETQLWSSRSLGRVLPPGSRRRCWSQLPMLEHRGPAARGVLHSVIMHF